MITTTTNPTRIEEQQMPKCDRCGRFMRCKPGASWAMRYSGCPPTPDHEAFRCATCTKANGPLSHQHGMREDTAGVFGKD